MSAKSNIRSLTEGSIRHHLWRMTLPMMWGILAIIGKSVVDTFFVARLGTVPLSAISFTFPVSLTIGSLAIGLGAGAASVVARAIGERDSSKVRRRATDALILSSTLVGLAAFAGWWFLDPLFGLLGAEGAVLEQVRAYMQIWFFGMPLLVVPMVGNSLIRAAGDGRIPGLIMLIGAILNIGLDPIFIFGYLGVPALGISGAAWAAVVANGLMLLASLSVLHWRERMLDGRMPSLPALIQSCRAVLGVGLPAATANMVNPIGIAVLTRMLADFGNETVAAFGVATRIEALAVVGMFALSATVGPIVGQNWGAGRGDRVQLALRRCYQYCVRYGLAMAVVLALAAPLVVSWFSDQIEVRQLAAAYLWIVPVSLFGYGINITGAAALNAVGMPLISTGLTFVRMVVIYLPLAWLLGARWGANGVFVAAAVANLSAGLLTVAVTRRHLGPGAALPPVPR